MGEVIQFVDQIVKHRGEDAKYSMGMRLMNRWYFNNRRLMQEADERRKSQEESQDE